ncbi:hypothetical protein GUITHDRAFT_112400 [Guillardia theta CCMP2712]|uniref:CBF1-interacting co-repressor CIR N-terminal domain-containing protein n=1 Tax=Guillardia theta (strain CCMP2712) TaxID=905079 RepID=L1IZJ0_GUITC|nr:hypothetical protein GUITHDRAFT_112400 [Guillardia theta CCMP2712]EKX41693.1 hypothetical protein GUITHDRAFT_112400 [Guillardia theta CCMP2712]|eukprot:XP_005828673.1 hypothetical protein GUITHDRAFT_112400 [Guillardia theta CCMP2712]
MSFGKLNILQHKKWNVWNRDNIEKVLRDENKHREDEEKKRKKRDENKKGFNLFEGLEHMIEGTVFNDTATASGKNKETVQEKKQEKEKEERKWGLMGLGKDNVTGENQNMKPWYALRQSEEAASYEGYGQ